MRLYDIVLILVCIVGVILFGFMLNICVLMN